LFVVRGHRTRALWEVAVLAVVVIVIADANAAVIVPLARALVSLLVTARPLSDLVVKHIATLMCDWRLAAEPLNPAVRAVAVSRAIHIIPASGTLAGFVGECLLITLNQRVVLQTAWGVVVVDGLVAGRIDAEVEVRHFVWYRRRR
jgi:hypothetical protein